MGRKFYITGYWLTLNNIKRIWNSFLDLYNDEHNLEKSSLCISRNLSDILWLQTSFLRPSDNLNYTNVNELKHFSVGYWLLVHSTKDIFCPIVFLSLDLLLCPIPLIFLWINFFTSPEFKPRVAPTKIAFEAAPYTCFAT